MTRAGWLALSTIIVIYVAVSSYAALTLPLPGTADAPDHLDYIYQVSIGQLPATEGHLLFPERGGRQFASAHPPVYYALMALIAGGHLPDDLPSAVALIRSVNIAFGTVTLLLIARFGWMVGGRSRAMLSVGTTAIAAVSFTMIRFGAEIYNDMFLTLVTTAALLMTAEVILRRPTWMLAIGLFFTAALGMGTKATFVITLAVCGGAIGLHSLITWRSMRTRERLPRMALTIAPTVVGIAANAWFYLRNADLSGSWYRSTPKSPVFDRAPRTTGEVLTDPEFWFVPLLRYVGRGTSEFAQTALLVSGLVIGALLLVTLIAGTRRIASARLRPDARRAVLFLALVFHVVGHYAAQLSHANGYGALNFRYFMPATLALAFIIAVGCVLLGRAGMVTIAAATAALGLLNAISVTVYAASMRNIEGYSVTLPAALVHQNGLSPWLALVCAGAAVAACLTFTVASSLLRSEPQTVNSDQRTRI